MIKLLILLLSTATIHASILDEFVKAQEWSFQKNTVYEYSSLFTAVSKLQNVTDNPAKIFATKGSTAVYTVQNGRPTIFLSTPLGVWISQKESPAPLKISGSYNVQGIMSVDDVIGVDYKNLYQIISETNNKVEMKSTTNSVSYPFVIITKINDNKFNGLFMDRNKTPLKFGEYTLGTVDGILTIQKAFFRDMIFDTNRTSSFEITSIKQSKIPLQIFVPERIKLLFNQVK